MCIAGFRTLLENSVTVLSTGKNEAHFVTATALIEDLAAYMDMSLPLPLLPPHVQQQYKSL